MARELERKGEEGPGIQESSLSTIDAIRVIAAHDARAPLDTEEQLTKFLKSWWSRTYNRPLKDPVLLSYTLEELIYEYYDRSERQKAEVERINLESDKIEEDKEKEVLDWAEQEEKKELEALKTQGSNSEEKSNEDPTKDPDNVAWMEEQMQKAKTTYGEDFGEDINENFE